MLSLGERLEILRTRRRAFTEPLNYHPQIFSGRSSRLSGRGDWTLASLASPAPFPLEWGSRPGVMAFPRHVLPGGCRKPWRESIRFDPARRFCPAPFQLCSRPSVVTAPIGTMSLMTVAWMFDSLTPNWHSVPTYHWKGMFDSLHHLAQRPCSFEPCTSKKHQPKAIHAS